MPMKPLVLLSLVALASAVYAQKPSDWKRSAIAPGAFAKNLDTKILQLKDAYGTGQYIYDLPIGKIEANLTMKIRNSKAFRINTLALNADLRSPFYALTVARNGKGITLWNSTTSKVSSLQYGQDPGFGAKNGVLNAWQTHFQQLIFQSYITGKGTFQALVADLAKPGSGFTTRIDERTLSSNGHKFPQVRLFATLSPAMAKKFGAASIEIVTDSRMWIPLQIRVIQETKQKARKLFQWTMSWEGPRKFKDSEFVVP